MASSGSTGKRQARYIVDSMRVASTSTTGVDLVAAQTTGAISLDAVAANGEISVGAAVDTDVRFNGTTATRDALWDASGNELFILDNAILAIGTGGDLTMTHNATDTILTSSTGDLVIDNVLVTGSTIARLGTDTAATSFEIHNNAGTAMVAVTGVGLATLDTGTTLFENASAHVRQATYNAAGGAWAPTAVQILDSAVYNGAAGGAVALTVPAATDMQTALLARGITSAAGMICGDIYVNSTGANNLTVTAADGTIVVAGTSAAINAQTARVVYIMTGAATGIAMVLKDT